MLMLPPLGVRLEFSQNLYKTHSVRVSAFSIVFRSFNRDFWVKGIRFHSVSGPSSYFQNKMVCKFYFEVRARTFQGSQVPAVFVVDDLVFFGLIQAP